MLVQQRPPEVPRSKIHVVSLIDASEEVIEPMAVATVENLEEAHRAAGNQLTGSVFLQRSNVSPAMKNLKSHLASTLPPLLGAATGAALGCALTGSLLLGALGGVVGMAVGGMVGRMAFGRTQMLKYLPQDAAEPFWTGSRTYQLGGDRTPAIDSRVVSQDPGSSKLDPAQMGQLLGEEMQKNPDATSVAHVFGHGLAYRQAAGLPFGQYRQMLAQATSLAGRPVDLLLVESCLEGNLESLLATAPYARYAVVSEEIVSAGAISQAFSKAVGALGGQAVTPRELGTAVVASNPSPVGEMLRFFFGMPPVDPEGPPEALVKQMRAETLALIDLDRVAGLGQAVDRLGAVLTEEVKDGMLPYLATAAEEAMVTGDPMLSFAKQDLGVGDLNVFVNRIALLYQQGTPSSRPREVMKACVEVQERLAEAVVANSIDPQFVDSAGLTVQLPTRRLGRLDREFDDTLARSAAPPRWREFVELASANL
ncbi:MAG: hypothetical protein AB1758_05810 [Candidatus Eremiobacterota bacterium]